MWKMWIMCITKKWSEKTTRRTLFVGAFYYPQESKKYPQNADGLFPWHFVDIVEN